MTFGDINCSRCIELLDDYRQGKLTSDEMARMDSHLAECGNCAAELRFRELLSDGLKNVLAGEIPRRLSPDVLTAIADSQAARQTVSQTSPLLPWMLAAAVVILIFVAMYQVRMPGHLTMRTVAMNRQYRTEQAAAEAGAGGTMARHEQARAKAALTKAKDEQAQKKSAPIMKEAEKSDNAMVAESREPGSVAAPVITPPSLAEPAPARALSDSTSADKVTPSSTMAGARLG
jgi:hypothetical protein